MQPLNPVPILSKQSTQDEDTDRVEFIGGFWWVYAMLSMDSRKKNAHELCVTEVEPGSRQELVRRAWAELVLLSSYPMNQKTGWASWRRAINHYMPKNFIEEFFGQSPVTTELLCELSDLTPRQVDYQQAKISTDRPRPRPLHASEILTEARRVANNQQTH